MIHAIEDLDHYHFAFFIFNHFFPALQHETGRHDGFYSKQTAPYFKGPGDPTTIPRIYQLPCFCDGVPSRNQIRTPPKARAGARAEFIFARQPARHGRARSPDRAAPIRRSSLDQAAHPAMPPNIS
jgi:hypothetical protein